MVRQHYDFRRFGGITEQHVAMRVRVLVGPYRTGK
jgi:hypothetical protein